jgi:tetratricopeptide (TPR) repeat protein
MTMKTSSQRSGWLVWAACSAAIAATVGMGGLARRVLAQTTTAPAAADPHAAALDAFRKARALYSQGNYADADAANNRALQLDPTLNEAKLLHKVLREKVGNGNSASSTAAGESDGASPTTGPAKVKALTMEQVSMIRLQELSAADTLIRGRVPRKALDAYWNTYVKNQTGADLSQGAYNKFVNSSNFMAQVRAIKDSNVQEFAESVEIASDPADMLAFRTAVEPYILQNCATSACHGGDKAGNFHLLRPGGSSLDQVIYTNFYIMSQYSTKDGGKVIDRDEPDLSLFLQYGLPKTVAHFAHPGKVEIKPHFGDKSAPEYQVMVNWVKSLAFPRPNYGVVYEIPGMTPAPETAPAKATPPRTGK